MRKIDNNCVLYTHDDGSNGDSDNDNDNSNGGDDDVHCDDKPSQLHACT